MSETTRCEECGTEIPFDVYEAQTALWGFRYGGFAGRDLARRIAEALDRKAPWSDEEIAADAVREWLGIGAFASLVAAVRHGTGAREDEQERRDSGDAGAR